MTDNKKKPRILLVEDNLDTCRMYETIMVNSGLVVDTAYDGQEAFEKISEGGYDLILLDVMLPKLSGVEVLEGLRINPPKGVNGPIVMLTNVGQEEVVRKTIALGAMSYMDKSNLDPQELVSKVLGVLGRGESGS